MMFDSSDHKEFFEELKEEGYHIYARANAQKGFYPNTFPPYPKLKYSDMREDDMSTVRVFFANGKEAMPRVDSGQIDLEIEVIDTKEGIVWGNIVTKLPDGLPLSRGTSIELTLDEILFVHPENSSGMSKDGLTPSSSMNLYQLQIKLLNIEPSVTRVVRTPGDISLSDLHCLIQNVMPWEFSHLHEFSTMDGDNFGPTGDPFGMDNDEGNVDDESTVVLERLLEEEGERLLYVYDFGDSWEHLITVERIAATKNGKREAVCLSGEGACPPEDCGGVPGYENLVEAMADKDHPERERLLEWLGKEFDPTAFDLSATNERLRKVKL